MPSFLTDEDAYEARLHEHLLEVLPEQGRALLDAGDSLAALRLFNRLLSIDEGNAEALALVQSLHGRQVRAASKPRLMAGVALAVLSAATVALLWVSQGTLEPTDPPAIEPGLADERLRVPDPTPLFSETLLPQEQDKDQPNAEQGAKGVPKPVSASRLGGRRPNARDPLRTPETLVDDGEPGAIVFQGNRNATVYIDGEPVGLTRQKISLPAGVYTAELQGDTVQTKTMDFTIEAGKTLRIPAELNLRPASVRFDPKLAADCQVLVDASERGTLQNLNWIWTTTTPDQPVEIGHACPGQARVTKNLKIVPPGETDFDAL